MLKGLKKILGIEGIVIELEVPEEIDTKAEKSINGVLKMEAKGDSRITALEFKIIEKYKRGRKDSKLIDEYQLGYKLYKEDILMSKGDKKDYSFTLPFELVHSDMDRLGKSNFLMKGVVGLAKMLKGASSVYRVEARVQIEGTKLNPHSVAQIILK